MCNIKEAGVFQNNNRKMVSGSAILPYTLRKTKSLSVINLCKEVIVNWLGKNNETANTI